MRCLCIAALVGVVAPSAAAQLVEKNVVMVWNHGDLTSRAIKEAYQVAHPDVIFFELEDDENPLPQDRGIDYSDYPPASTPNLQCLDNCIHEDCGTCSICNPNQSPGECLCCSCPSYAIGVHVDGQGQSLGWAMDEFYITPNMYEHFIAQPLREFLEDYADTDPEEPILAIVTTRGVPATISESFDPGVNHQGACILGSVESHLAGLNFSGRDNPYKAHLNKPFTAWINTPITECNPDGGLPYKGKIFLTSRLDSGLGYDSNHAPTGTHVQAVEALIARSENLTVNKFACTIVIDSKDGILEEWTRGFANFMRDWRWCVYYDATPAFLHGLFQPQTSSPDCGTFNASGEEQYVGSWPELVHYTIGRNVYVFGSSPTAQPVCNDYVKWYYPHPAGIFLSYESYNGIGLRKPNWPDPSDLAGPGWTHGSLLHWIGRGGSFCIAPVNGAGSSWGTYVIPNLYNYGLSWGEAAWSEPISFKSIYCPIGDPLARVVVYDPDFNGNGVIDGDDLTAAMEGEFDVNGDSLFDQEDVDRVLEALGRNPNNFPALPPSDWPPWPPPSAHRCGDLNSDHMVNAADLAIFDARITQCGYEHYSGLFDVNHDWILTPADRAIIAPYENAPRCLRDVNGSGCLTFEDPLALADFLDLYSELCDPEHTEWNELFDIDCDGCINEGDYKEVSTAQQHGWQCPGCGLP